MPLKYLSNFWKTLETSSINCKTNHHLKWSANCILVAGTVVNQVPTLKITDPKHNVPVVPLSTQYNAKKFKQLESGFKRTINWKKYQSKKKIKQKTDI